MAMYVNHCCDPNCETEEDEEGRVWIAAMRDMYDGEGDAPCTCGTHNCRGTMYSKKEMRKRQRTARTKKTLRKKSRSRSGSE
jgi:hypothetical protein